MYDELLAAAELTVTQFTLLVFLCIKDNKPIAVLAARTGLDPTTLNRRLKPLLARKLVRNGADPADRRVRTILLTPAGRAKVQEGLPLWREAQRRIGALCGADTVSTLNDLLDGAYAKLGDEGRARK
jgi:DNA-binding MarR family transcriptional regulator